MRYCCWLFAALFVGPTLPAWAQDVTSGPAKGEKLPPVRVWDATGPHKEKEVDYAAERDDKPTVYIVIQADRFDRPMARFLKILDDAVLKESDDACVVAVWLTDDRDKTKEYLPRVQQSIRLANTALTCFTGEKFGPNNWGINSDAHATVVVVSKQKVAETRGYRAINETDVPAVRDALKKALQ